MRKLLTKLFGDPNEAPLKPYQQVIAQVNALEPQMEALSDLELRELTNGLRDRLEEGETLDNLLPESFAATREARCCTPARSPRCAPAKVRH
jgi:preprotein translocase subunit SecA